ncbi:MAG: FAD-dependent oxidoreductase [Haloarculaceae archaeon]
MDVIVVGGGILGSATAYHLATAGVDVGLFDRADEGRATDAGAGILSPATSSNAGSEPWFEFAVDAVDYYGPLDAELRDAGVEETGYAVPGLLQVAVNEAEARVFDEALARIRDRQERLGAPERIDELTPEEARERSPIVGGVERALWNPNGGRVDGRVFAAALREAGERAGLAVREADVTSIRVESGTVEGVVADGERVDAEAIVVAGGAWSPEFAADLGFDVPVEPMRGQILHLETDHGTDEWPIVTGTRSLYTVPWAGGRVAVGATYEEGSGYAPHTTVEGVHEVLGDALDVVPGLAEAAIGEIRVGLRPGSADGLPVCGRVPGVEGAYLATGHGPTGLQMGPYTGRQVARLVRGEPLETDMDAFSPARFENR